MSTKLKLTIAGLLVGLGLIYALSRVIVNQVWPASPHEIQLDALRRLAASGQDTALAAALDQSMALVPAGEFVMGADTASEDERPERRVYLDGFKIDRYEVTNAQYSRFVLTSSEAPPHYWPGGKYPPGQADRPVVGVSWQRSQAYCAWAGKRLPTEAEWEKACRGPADQVYPWGDEWQPVRANVGADQADHWPPRLDDGWLLLQSTANAAGPQLQPVGSYPNGQSDYGIFDLVGSASEWVADWYNWAGYARLPQHNPLNTAPPWNHVVRGSAWFDQQGRANLIPAVSRCAARSSSHSYDDPRLGFRCAR
jgi:formylglycine-generating enzyme required for sulfatase activity